MLHCGQWPLSMQQHISIIICRTPKVYVLLIISRTVRFHVIDCKISMCGDVRCSTCSIRTYRRARNFLVGNHVPIAGCLLVSVLYIPVKSHWYSICKLAVSRHNDIMLCSMIIFLRSLRSKGSWIRQSTGRNYVWRIRPTFLLIRLMLGPMAILLLCFWMTTG